MITTIKNWWNKDAIKAQETIDSRLAMLESALEKTKAEATAAVVALEDAEEKLHSYRVVEEADAAKKAGTEPWVEVRSAGLDPVKGIQIELDWNEAFIQYLKDNGMTGRDEDTIVQKWLAFLYEDLINNLEQKVIDKSDSDSAKVSDFV